MHVRNKNIFKESFCPHLRLGSFPCNDKSPLKTVHRLNSSFLLQGGNYVAYFKFRAPLTNNTRLIDWVIGTVGKF